MTLEEIAALAGVSRSTVSRVINNQPRVSQSTRTQVQKVIRTQGYHPNVAARTLASRRSQTILLIVAPTMSNFTSPYYTLIMQGVTLACDQRAYNLMLSPAATQTTEGYERTLRSGLVDGVLVATSSVGTPFLNWLHSEGHPFVLIGRDPNLPDINTVSADSERGGAMAAQHLVWLGYTRIAIITGAHDHGGAIDRRVGFLTALRDAGRACPSDYIVESDFSEYGGYQAMQRLLTVHPRPQAVFGASDLSAIGAMRAVRDAGLHVPEDVAIIGFDDIPLAETVQPPLTTVRQPIQQIGFTAASMLIDILETRAADPERRLAPQHVVLPTELIVRESCGQTQRYEARRPSPRGTLATA
jgi:LacI family transcriptional regulator